MSPWPAPVPTPPAGYLAAAAAATAGAVILTRCGSSLWRWVTTAVWAPALTGLSLVAHPALPILAGIPWLVIACVYSSFRGWSYHDLVATGPRLATAVRKAIGAGELR